MAFCGNCGNELKDGAKFCPKCGNPVNSSSNPQIEAKNSNLYIRWDGAWALFDASMTITANGTFVGNYSFKEGFEAIVPIKSEAMRIGIKFSFREYFKVFNVRTDTDYTLNLSYNRVSGGFGFTFYDTDGNEYHNDSLHWVMAILCFLIPIFGLIFGLYNNYEKPAASKDAILLSVIGFIVGLLIYFFKLS